MNQHTNDRHMKKVLVEAVVFMAAFLELSDDDTIDPDVAADQEHILGSIFYELSAEERSEFMEHVAEMIEQYQTDPSRAEFTDFLRSFGANFGLIDEDPD